MREIDAKFKTFLRDGAKSPPLRSYACLTRLSADLPAFLQSDPDLSSVGANCAKTLATLAETIAFDPWVRGLCQKPFPGSALVRSRQNWILSRIALISVLEEQLKWLGKSDRSGGTSNPLKDDPRNIRVCIAHTDGAALAVCTYGIEIGCDIERRDREFSDAFKQRLRSDGNPLVHWVAMEAAFKSDPYNKTGSPPLRSTLNYGLQTQNTILRPEPETYFTYESFVYREWQIGWAFPQTEKPRV